VRELVAAAPVAILIIDEQPFSFAELEQRQSLLTQALSDLGFDNFATSFDIEHRVQLEATVQRIEGAPATVAEIVTALPASIASDVDVEIWDEPMVIDE
jgi:hypothetical protein